MTSSATRPGNANLPSGASCFTPSVSQFLLSSLIFSIFSLFLFISFLVCFFSDSLFLLVLDSILFLLWRYTFGKKLWGKIHMLNCNYKEVFLFFVVSAHLFTPQVGGKMSISLQSCTFCEFGSPLVHVQVYPLKSVRTPRHG